MLEISKEYIAGLFDGEGHVSITWATRRGVKCPKLCVKISNTHLPVLLKIKAMYGGSIYANKKQYESYLQCYVLSFTVEQSKKFLKDILPYTIIKQSQIIEALKFASTVYRRGKSIISEKEKIIREDCMIKVREEKLKSWDNIKDFDACLKEFETGWIQYRQLIPDNVCNNFVKE